MKKAFKVQADFYVNDDKDKEHRFACYTFSVEAENIEEAVDVAEEFACSRDSYRDCQNLHLNVSDGKRTKNATIGCGDNNFEKVFAIKA